MQTEYERVNTSSLQLSIKADNILCRNFIVYDVTEQNLLTYSATTINSY